MTAQEILVRGGPLMVVLLGLSVLASAILLTKAWQFVRLGLRRLDFVDAALDELGRGQDPTAALAGSDHPVARVFETAVRVGRDARVGAATAQAEVVRSGTAELRGLETWLRALSSIAHLSPLVGLLGTVLGMIAAFMRIEEAGATVDPALLSGGIWQALITTAFGLTIAIPSMAAYHVLEGEVDRTRAAMQDAAGRVLAHFDKLTATPTVLPATVEHEERDDHAV